MRLHENSREGGYAGLVVLLVSVVIVAFLFVRVYLTPNKTENVDQAGVRQEIHASTTAPTTEVGRLRADIDAANAARDLLNARSKETNALLEEGN